MENEKVKLSIVEYYSKLEINKKELDALYIKEDEEPLFLDFVKKQKDSAKKYFALGLIYNHGYGVEINDEEALKWYKKAADKKCLNACLYAAEKLSFDTYFDDDDDEKQTKKIEKQIIDFYVKAAKLGSVEAEWNLVNYI